MKELYFVHAVDTEGPLYEPIEETFNLLQKIFGISIEPTEENLKKLQNKQINLNGIEEAVAKFVSPNRLNYKKDWHELEQHIREITSFDFRNQFLDDENKGWVFSWFVMDHVGFNDMNPRRRSIGDHIIFDFYKKIIENQDFYDDLQFHYHPLAIINAANASGNTFLWDSNLFRIIAKKIIDRKWFPAVYRPGFHTERPELNWFLEQWIPFDYGNQSISSEEDQPDLSYGRFGDWRGAPDDWTVYHPSIYDYRKKGNCRRLIARCLNIGTRIRNINQLETNKAFELARKNGKAIIALTNHDFRDMKEDIYSMYDMLKKAKEKYKDVKVYFEKSINAFRKLLDIPKSYPKLSLNLFMRENDYVIDVKAEGEIFGVQPFLAIKTHEKNYYWQNFDFIEEKRWQYTFDGHNTLSIKAVEKIGVAINSPYGIGEVLVLDVESGKIEKNILNDE